MKEEKPDIEILLWTAEPITDQARKELYFNRFIMKGLEFSEIKDFLNN
tara:strand:- start:656 stop:799 length:144 start_codon:yes stop_codon:yes gene_type:complete